jgi:hypothetical protein
MGLWTIKTLYEETKMNVDKCKECNCNCHCNVKDHSDFKGVCPCEDCKCKILEDNEKTT